MQHIQIHNFSAYCEHRQFMNWYLSPNCLLTICQEVSTETKITYLETDKTPKLAYSVLEKFWSENNNI